MSDRKPRLIGINHVAIEVGDIDEALDWYGKIFDFSLRGKLGLRCGVFSNRSRGRWGRRRRCGCCCSRLGWRGSHSAAGLVDSADHGIDPHGLAFRHQDLG